jgi:RND family efflux transporter MFP subunit
MKLFHKESKIKKIIKKPYFLALIAILVLVTAVSAGKGILGNGNGEDANNNEVIKKQVQTVVVDLNSSTNSFIEAVGTVKAETQIDILSTTRGTLKGLFFEVGDEVGLNKVLASLFDSATLTNLNNAQTNLSNSENNLIATDQISSDNIRQAELGVESAKQSVQSAEIGLKSAKDQLENAKALREKGNEDGKSSAISAFNGYMNTVFTSLDSVNDILKIDDFSNTTLSSGLGAKNLNSLQDARSGYVSARDAYDALETVNLNNSNIEKNMEGLVSLLGKTDFMLARIIVLLENSVSSQSFPQSSIDLQKNLMVSQRTAVVSSLSAARLSLQGLQNQDLVGDQELSALENAVSASETQLALANTALDNAKITLENTKQAREQQLIGSKTGLDNARGQLNLARSSAGDLSIKAPIAGTITGKYVEVGAEINPGQRIAQISQTNMLKIEVSLPSEDIYRIKEGQNVIIGDGLEAKISLIDPAADPITRKVKIEILFDNKDKELIQGTFIDVSFPVEALEKTHSESVYIPLKTITTTQTESFVFIARENKAIKSNVSLGKTEGALIEVLSGIRNGDALIVEGGKNLEDGDEIEIINQ